MKIRESVLLIVCPVFLILTCVYFWVGSHLGTFYVKKDVYHEIEFFVEHGSFGVTCDPWHYSGYAYMIQGPFLSYKSAPNHYLRKPKPTIIQTIFGRFEFSIASMFSDPLSGKNINRAFIVFPFWLAFLILIIILITFTLVANRSRQ